MNKQPIRWRSLWGTLDYVQPGLEVAQVKQGLEQYEQRMPFYMLAAIAMGTFFISGSLLLWLWAIDLFDLDQPLNIALLGAVGVGTGLALYRLAGGQQTPQSLWPVFVWQSAFALMACGKVLWVAGFGLWLATDSSDASVVLAICLSSGIALVATYSWYPVWLDRFITASVFLLSLWWYIAVSTTGLPQMLLICVFFSLLCSLSLAFFVLPVNRQWSALAWSALAVVFWMLVQQIPFEGSAFDYSVVPPDYFIYALFLLCSVGIYIYVSNSTGGKQLQLSSVGLIAAVMTYGLLCLLNIPAGALLALLLMVLAYLNYDRIMSLAAGIGLIFFISAYYYNLAFDLLAKSLALLGAGGVLLVAAGVLAWSQNQKRLAKEE